VPKWRTLLRYADFKLFAMYSSAGKQELQLNQAFPGDLPRMLVIELLNRKFCDWNGDEENALRYVGARLQRLDEIPSTDDFLSPTIAPDTVQEVHVDNIMNHLQSELEGRLEVVDLAMPSVWTRRAFVSPFLIGAIRIVHQYLSNNDSSTRTALLVDGKFVCGARASGLVDYAIALDGLDVVVTVHADTAGEGLLQNLLQQQASLEFVTNVVMEYDVAGAGRRKRFRDDCDALGGGATYGVVTNGAEWVFTKCVRVAGQPTLILRSHPIVIDYEGARGGRCQLSTWRRVLCVLANLMVEQLRAIDTGELHKRLNGLPPLQLMKLAASEGRRIIDEARAIDGDSDSDSDGDGNGSDDADDAEDEWV
jgi:hypothetical protein